MMHHRERAELMYHRERTELFYHREWAEFDDWGLRASERPGEKWWVDEYVVDKAGLCLIHHGKRLGLQISVDWIPETPKWWKEKMTTASCWCGEIQVGPSLGPGTVPRKAGLFAPGCGLWRPCM
mmetsp:Transcript_8721/g.16928  ORF Transcript_8721/g.16928 Transcript_8721/m.16928 type:complete len:124 (-) Transcript_8721:161-532(-)